MLKLTSLSEPLTVVVLFVLFGLALITFLIWRYVYPTLKKGRKLSPELATPALLVDDDPVFPDSKFVTIDGFNIRYVQRGKETAPALVLIHGFSGYIYSWRDILDELAKDYHVIALDLPGFGRSAKMPAAQYGLDHQTQRILQFLDYLKVHEFAVGGHSMGGSIAAWMAKKHSERVKKLVLIAPAVGGASLVNFNPDYLKWSLPFLKKRLVNLAYFREVYMRVSTVRDQAKLDAALQHYYSPYEKDHLTVETTYQHLYLLRDRRLQTELRHIACPVLVIGGEKDPVVTPARLRSFIKDNPKAILIMHPQSGHLVAEEYPDFVIPQIRNFLRSE